MPEPPALDGSRIAQGVSTLLDDGFIAVLGEPGAASRGAIVRATNLDDSLPPLEVAVTAEGSFVFQIELPIGSELRLQPVTGAARGEPLDWLREMTQLVPAPRHECVELSTQAMTFERSGLRELEIVNDCPEPVSIGAPRTRLGLEDFAVLTALPLELESGASASVQVDFAPEGPEPREDVVFLEVTLDGVVRRHPVTLFGQARSED